MIRFHKSAQDGWLQKQLFLQCSFAAAPRRPNLSVRQGSVASHSQPLYRVRARLKPSLRSTLGNFGTRLTQTAPLEGISPDKSACVNRWQKLLDNGQTLPYRLGQSCRLGLSRWCDGRYAWGEPGDFQRSVGLGKEVPMTRLAR
jgi:hypothetical protein